MNSEQSSLSPPITLASISSLHELAKAFYEQVEYSFTCTICYNMLEDAVQCQQCSAKFCKADIDHWKKHRSICPSCRANLKEKPVDRDLAITIAHFKLMHKALDEKAYEEPRACSFTKDCTCLLCHQRNEKNMSI